jgi:hypothetical protein
VELWDEARVAVEQVLAVTANGSIGYAAFYAAPAPVHHASAQEPGDLALEWSGTLRWRSARGKPIMAQRETLRARSLLGNSAPPPTGNLPYAVALWRKGDRELIERVLARAPSAALARAIFKAAQTEHPERRITLHRGERLIADTTE